MVLLLEVFAIVAERDVSARDMIITPPNWARMATRVLHI